MKAVLKFTDKTIERIRSDEIKDTQHFLDEMTNYRLESVVKAADKADEDAIYLLCEVAKALSQKENGIFLTTEESVTYGKRLHEAMRYTAAVRRGLQKQVGRFSLHDPNSVKFLPTKKGFEQANKLMDVVAKKKRAEKEGKDDAPQ